MRCWINSCTIIGGAALAACGPPAHESIPPNVLTILNKPDEFELVALDPYANAGPGVVVEPTYQHVVLGRATITDAIMKQELTDTLINAVRPATREDRSRSKCFSPRHLVRATRDGIRAEFYICFECRHMVIRLREAHVADPWIPSESAKVFDDALRRLGIEPAQPPSTSRPAE